MEIIRYCYTDIVLLFLLSYNCRLFFDKNLLSGISIIKSLLSPFWGFYWFVTVYICFYLLCPFLNKFVQSLGERELGVFVLILAVVSQMMQMLIRGNSNYGTMFTFCFLFFSGLS